MPLENEDTPVTTATQTAIMAYRTLGIIVIAAAKILTTEKVSGTLIRSKNSSAAEFCARRVAQTILQSVGETIFFNFSFFIISICYYIPLLSFHVSLFIIQKYQNNSKITTARFASV